MARFYFHLREENELIEDEEGIELPSHDAAYAFAVKNARDIIAATIQSGKLMLDAAVDIADADGNVIQTVAYRDAITVVGGPQL